MATIQPGLALPGAATFGKILFKQFYSFRRRIAGFDTLGRRFLRRQKVYASQRLGVNFAQ